jgi:hypothetical protein
MGGCRGGQEAPAKTVVVLHAKQAIGPGLAAAFLAYDRFRVLIWTSGDVAWVFRDGVQPHGVAIEPLPAGAADRLREAAREGPIEVVTNDEYCLRPCADLRAALGLPPRLPPDLEAWTDKVCMKDRLRTAGIATPDFVSLDPVPEPPEGLRSADGLGLPLVVKPRRESNNRGIGVLRSRAELASWLEEHRGQAGWEAESFVEGRLHHANALVVDGRVAPVQVAVYTAPLLAFNEGRPAGGVTLPEDHPDAVAGRSLNAGVLRALGGRGSFVVHTEFFVTRAGEAVFLETAARAPGALVSEMAEIHAGVHLERASFLLQAGEAPPQPRPGGRHAAWLWFPDPRVLPGRGAVGRRLRSEHTLEVQRVGPYFMPAGLLAWNVDHGCLLRDVEEAQAMARR